MEFPGVAARQTEWDDFFVHNPGSKHRRRIAYGLMRRHALEFKTVLDVGCGDGQLLEEMHRLYGCELHGIELGRSSAPERLEGRLSGFHRFSIEERCLDQAFDLVLCTEVLEHLKEPETAVRNIARMCRGHLLVTVPAGPVRKTDIAMGHVRHYDVGSITALLSGAGFEALECFAWGFPFHSLYRWLLDRFPAEVIDSYGRARYGWKEKAVCRALSALFYLNVRAGGQLFYLGRRRADPLA